MSEVHHRPRGGQGSDPSRARARPALDFTDPTAVRSWLAELRDQIEDLASAGEDATRPLGRRALGRRVARRAVLEARRAIRSLLAAVERPTA